MKIYNTPHFYYLYSVANILNLLENNIQIYKYIKLIFLQAMAWEKNFIEKDADYIDVKVCGIQVGDHLNCRFWHCASKKKKKTR